MQYTSTRDASVSVSGAEAILKGLSAEGGLFVPTQIPSMNFEELMGESYTEIATAVLKAYLPDYDEEFLRSATLQSYGEAFGQSLAKMHRVKEGVHSLELWHGPTAAFKDYALQLMPRLLVQARRMLAEKGETLILVATSGDTGSAALAGYSGLEGVKIAAFYPVSGVSELQRLQMTTMQGDNICVYAVKGNFDDAQRGVKVAFTDEKLAEKLAKGGVKLSSANSINWGRLVPQIVYYITSYLHLCTAKEIAYGEKVDYYVPTGNFGDILAGWYAKQMGLPVGRLVCAANQNNVLADFLSTGVYSTNREFHKTSSPSMDILVSSNLERLLWHSCKDAQKISGYMRQLTQDGEYRVQEEIMCEIRKTFAGGWASEQSVCAQIQEMFKTNNYLCDTHTAVAFEVMQNMPFAAENHSVVLSTASPYKFCANVLQALNISVPQDPFEALSMLEQKTGTTAPVCLSGLSEKSVRFSEVIEAEEISGIPLRAIT